MISLVNMVPSAKSECKCSQVCNCFFFFFYFNRAYIQFLFSNCVSHGKQKTIDSGGTYTDITADVKGALLFELHWLLQTIVLFSH
jgi:hypothetical protein